MSVVKVSNLVKFYGKRRVLDRLNFTVHQGEVFGYLGPNGAGKTTTISILMGLLRPTEGQALVFGERLDGNDTLRRRVGVLFENCGLYDRLTAGENLNYYARLYEVENRATRIAELLDYVGLAEWAKVRTGEFSTGMKRKLGIARALLHQPDLLFLDEPTASLDPEAQKMVRDLITNLSQNSGMTVFINSHNLIEIERICHRIAILRAGRLQACDTVDSLRAAFESRRLEIVLSDPGQKAQTLQLLGAIDGVGEMEASNGRLVATLEQKSAAHVLRELVQAGIGVEEFRRQSSSLEDVYLELAGREGEE